MYEKPRVERFGTFRDLTRIGFSGTGDGFLILASHTHATSDTGSTGDDLRS